MISAITTGRARTLAGIGAFAAAIAIGAPAVAALGDDAPAAIRAASTAPTPDIERGLGPHTPAVAAAVPPTTTVAVASSESAPPDVSVDPPDGGGSNVDVDTNGAPDVAVSANASSTQHAAPSSISTNASGSSNAPNASVSTSSTQMSQSTGNGGGATTVQTFDPDDVFGPGNSPNGLPQMPNVPTPSAGFGR
jgi:hypothetical protein